MNWPGRTTSRADTSLLTERGRVIFEHCDVTYDPVVREFSCPSGARWTLDGSVIHKPRPTFPDDPLSVLLVRISLDDHVLVSPNVFMSDTKLNLGVTDA